MLPLLPLLPFPTSPRPGAHARRKTGRSLVRLASCGVRNVSRELKIVVDPSRVDCQDGHHTTCFSAYQSLCAYQSSTVSKATMSLVIIPPWRRGTCLAATSEYITPRPPTSIGTAPMTTVSKCQCGEGGGGGCGWRRGSSARFARLTNVMAVATLEARAARVLPLMRT